MGFKLKYKIFVLFFLVSFKSLCQSNNLVILDSLEKVATQSFFNKETIRLIKPNSNKSQIEYWVYTDKKMDNYIIYDKNFKIIYLTNYDASKKAIKEKFQLKNITLFNREM